MNTNYDNLYDTDNDREPVSLATVVYVMFMAVMIPTYVYHYGLVNFLYFCDISCLLVLYGLLANSHLCISAATVGIIVPQLVWIGDFLTGGSLTAYMYDANVPLYVRFLSLFHMWLPLCLLCYIYKNGYHRRGFFLWLIVGCMDLYACLFAGKEANINFVYSDGVDGNYIYCVVGCFMVTLTGHILLVLVERLSTLFTLFTKHFVW